MGRGVERVGVRFAPDQLSHMKTVNMAAIVAVTGSICVFHVSDAGSAHCAPVHEKQTTFVPAARPPF